MQRVTLSSRLLAYVGDPDPEHRARVAEAVARSFGEDALGPEDRAWLRAILERLVEDATVFVRQAISVQLASSPLLPRALAEQLAHDVASVANPVLRCSPVLSDADLLSIAETGDLEKLLAISRRARLTGELSHALVEHGDAEVTSSLLVNTRAELHEPTLDLAARRHGDRASVQRAFLHRGELPPRVVLALAERVNAGVRRELLLHYDLPEPIVDQVIKLSEEQSLDFLAGDAHGAQLSAVVATLKRAGKLTDTLLLRAFLEGRVGFVVAGLAARALLPRDAVARALFRGDVFRRCALYREADVDPELTNAFNALVAVTGADVLETRRLDEDFQDEAVRHIVQAYADVAPGDVDVVIAALQRHVERARATGRGSFRARANAR